METEPVKKVAKEKSKGRVEAGKRLAKLNKERRIERTVVQEKKSWFDDTWFNAGVVAGVVVVGGYYYYKTTKEPQKQITYTKPEVIEEPTQIKLSAPQSTERDPFSMK